MRKEIKEVRLKVINEIISKTVPGKPRLPAVGPKAEVVKETLTIPSMEIPDVLNNLVRSHVTEDVGRDEQRLSIETLSNALKQMLDELEDCIWEQEQSGKRIRAGS